MPATPLFKDLYKPFKDQQTKSFETSHKIELKPKGSPDIEIDLLAPSVLIKTKAPVVEDVKMKIKGTGPSNGVGTRIEWTNEFTSQRITLTDTATLVQGSGIDYSITTQYETDGFAAAATFESKKSMTHALAGQWKATFNAVKAVGKALLGAQASMPLIGDTTPELRFGGRFSFDEYALGFESDLASVTVGALYYTKAIVYGLEAKLNATLLNSVAAVLAWNSAKVRLELPTGRAQAAVWGYFAEGIKLNVATEMNIFDATKGKWGVGATVERAI